MLSIEKKDLSLKFSSKERLCTNIFLQAFALACLVHILGFVLFRIQPITFSGASWIFPAVMVDADQRIAKELVIETSSTNSRERFINSLTLPEPSNPDMHLVTSMMVIPHTFIMQDNRHLFSQIERTNTFLTKEDFLRIPKHTRISVAGDLAMREVVANGLDHQLEAAFGENHLRYSVQVDNQTGKIIWFELQQSDGTKNRDIAGSVESILQNMRFKEVQQGFVTLGEIEFTFVSP